MFNNGLQILQPTCEKWQYSIVSYFFVLTTVAGFYTKCICTCPKGNMQGQSPIRNVAGNIWVPVKQYKSKIEVSLRKYHKEPHFLPVWLTILWCKHASQLLVWIQRIFLFSVHISFSSSWFASDMKTDKGRNKSRNLH